MGSEWWQPVAAAASVVLAVVAAYQAGRAAKSAEAAAGKAAKEASDELYERLRTNDFAHVEEDIRRLDVKIDSTKHELDAKIDSTRAHLEAGIDRVDARVDRVDDRLKETRLELKHDIRASEARLLEAISGVRDLVTGLREAQL